MGTDELMSYAEAADLLGVTVRTIVSFNKDGLLKPIIGRVGGLSRVRREDVLALAEARRTVDKPKKAIATALRSEAKSNGLERRVAALEAMLGVHNAFLPTEEPEVVALYERARAGVDDPPTSEEDVMQWAMTLVMMGEEFFEQVVAVTGDEEAWRIFANFGRAVSSYKPTERFDSDKRLESAYGYFEYARRCLEGSLFLYVQRHHGMKLANEHFKPVASNPHEHILRLVTMANASQS